MIIVAGHTHEKMEQTISMLPDSLERVLIFNGPDPFPGAIHTSNTPGRDVAMYNQALKTTDWDRVFFINDDVDFIDDSFWKEKDSQEDICGVGNLATWIPEHMQTNHTRRQGRVLRFIRTSAICATRDFFFKTFALARGEAQRFEKATLHTGNYKILDPLTFYDGNTKEYFDYLKNNS